MAIEGVLEGNLIFWKDKPAKAAEQGIVQVKKERILFLSISLSASAGNCSILLGSKVVGKFPLRRDQYNL